MQFMSKVLHRSGLGDETYAPPSEWMLYPFIRKHSTVLALAKAASRLCWVWEGISRLGISRLGIG